MFVVNAYLQITALFGGFAINWPKGITSRSGLSHSEPLGVSVSPFLNPSISHTCISNIICIQVSHSAFHYLSISQYLAALLRLSRTVSQPYCVSALLSLNLIAVLRLSLTSSQPYCVSASLCLSLTASQPHYLSASLCLSLAFSQPLFSLPLSLTITQSFSITQLTGSLPGCGAGMRYSNAPDCLTVSLSQPHWLTASHNFSASHYHPASQLGSASVWCRHQQPISSSLCCEFQLEFDVLWLLRRTAEIPGELGAVPAAAHVLRDFLHGQVSASSLTLALVLSYSIFCLSLFCLSFSFLPSPFLSYCVPYGNI